MPSAMTFGEIDRKCINAIRILAAEMVQKANSGHPGAPMGLAPLAHVLFTRFLRCNPKNPLWVCLNGLELIDGSRWVVIDLSCRMDMPVHCNM